jgi:hypothetical protein
MNSLRRPRPAVLGVRPRALPRLAVVTHGAVELNLTELTGGKAEADEEP